MTKSECVKRARSLNRTANAYRVTERTGMADALRALRDDYMLLARESFIVGPGY